jgi:hypothetical protein
MGLLLMILLQGSSEMIVYPVWQLALTIRFISDCIIITGNYDLFTSN